MTDEKKKETCDEAKMDDESSCGKAKESGLAGPKKVTEEPESSEMKSGENAQKTDDKEKDEGGKPTEGKGVGSMKEENAVKEEAKAAKKEMAKADEDCGCGTEKSSDGKLGATEDDENPANKGS